MSDKPTICIDMAEKRSDLPEVGFYPDNGCPKCGGDLEMGFGMAGGGMGVYEYCTGCGEIITKTEEAND